MSLTTPNYDLTTLEGKNHLAELILQTPQVSCGIVHRFGPGVYIREASYPSGTVIVGQVHRTEHINILLKGSINVIDGEGAVAYLTAPTMFVSKIGSKVGCTLTDVIWQNIYAIEGTDVEELENLLFESPVFFEEHLAKRIEEQRPSKQEDRDDFLQMLKDTHWAEEDVKKCSEFRDDVIPMPYGSYSMASGTSPIEGKGMFATSPIMEGETLAPMRLGGYRTPAGYLINHSVRPNCKALVNDKDDMYLVAKRDIHGMIGGELGEELTLDYRQVMLINKLWDGK